jgi:hypothetical protein
MPKLRSKAVEAGSSSRTLTPRKRTSSDCKSVQSASRTGASIRQGAQAAYQKFKDHLSGPVPGVSDRPVIQYAFQNYRRLPLGLAYSVTDPSPAM